MLHAKFPIRMPENHCVFDIKAAIESGKFDQAIHIFLEYSIHPDRKSLFLLLKACAKLRSIERGRAIHAESVKHGMERDLILGTILVDMYAKCGFLVDAQEIFDELAVHDVVSWTALISGYAENGLNEETLKCLVRMQAENISPNCVTYICTLKGCGNLEEIDMGYGLHAEIIKEGFEKELFIGSTLVDMYAKCGFLKEAQEIFEELTLRNIVTWNALIAGYAKHGVYGAMLDSLEHLEFEGLSPDTVTYICCLKGCGDLKMINIAQSLYSQITSKGLEQDFNLCTTVVNTFTKCGLCLDALKIFNAMPVHDTILWNTLIGGYVQQDKGHEALNCYERMQREGLYPDIATFICVLKACGKVRALDNGKHIHEKMVRKGLLEKNIDLGTALVDMYVKCGDLTKAREVLEGLPVRDLVAWNALIAGYAQEGQFFDVLNCFEQIQNEGLSPDAVTFIFMLKAAGDTGSIDMGKQIHDKIVNRGLLNSVVRNGLVDMYSKCGLVAKAREIFEKLPIRDVVSWSALIAGYVQQGQAHEALKCFEQMQGDGLSPNSVTFICILNACRIIKDLDKGKQIHEEVVSRGLLEKDIGLGFALVDMYANCGLLAKAQEVIDALPIRTGAPWSALIAGYAEWGKGHEAIKYYEWMQSEGLATDVISFTRILKACGNTGAIEMGKQIHSKILSSGLLKKSGVLGTALVDMYVKCGMLAKAQQVLDDLPIQETISWNALIAGYARQGLCDEALGCYDQMRSEGLSPDAVTFTCILKACGSTKAIGKGKLIHEEVSNRGLQVKNVVVATALVDMYVKCGVYLKAQRLLEELHIRDSILWNALIAGYAQQGEHHEAVNCFARMQSEGLAANEVTFSCILKVCGRVGFIEKGKQVHDDIVRRDMLQNDVLLGTALVDMYAKCGMLAKAHQVLENLPVQDVICWNAFIAGCAQQGKGYKALQAYRQMQNEGLSPDKITFLCVLSACSHSGLLDEAEMVFGDMTGKYGITPSLKHHTNMVMVFGLAGHFDKAISIIKGMPYSDHSEIWLALLCGCKKWGNVKLGRLTFDQMVQLENCCGAAYFCMADIFVAAGMQQDAKTIDAMRLKYVA